MEREVGGGIGMGNTCKPMAVSFQCMTKSTTNKKKKKEGSHSLNDLPLQSPKSKGLLKFCSLRFYLCSLWSDPSGRAFQPGKNK